MPTHSDGTKRCGAVNAAASSPVYSLKKVVPSLAVIFPAAQATVLETAVQTHKDTDRSGPASPSVPCRRGPPCVHASLVFRTGIPYGACYCARKQDWLVLVGVCMGHLQVQPSKNTTANPASHIAGSTTGSGPKVSAGSISGNPLTVSGTTHPRWRQASASQAMIRFLAWSTEHQLEANW